MIRRVFAWDPPLYVIVPMLFAVVCGVSLAMSGTITPFAVLLAVVCSGAQWSRKRRHRA